MIISYTDHSLDRLNERGISKKEVAEALAKGEKGSAVEGSRRCTHRTPKGTLTVIYDIKNPSAVEIITAYRSQL